VELTACGRRLTGHHPAAEAHHSREALHLHVALQQVVETVAGVGLTL
jgi:hypothetical protein